jgi:hypothetical protein
VQSERRFRPVFLEDSRLEHFRGAAHFPGRRALLGRLEHEQHVAAQPRLRFHQHLGHSHQDRGMRVVAAGVHHADFLATVVSPRRRPERHVGALGDRQGVHVGAQRDRGTRLTRPQQGDDTGLRDAGFHVQPQLFQVFGCYLRCAHFPV